MYEPQETTLQSDTYQHSGGYSRLGPGSCDLEQSGPMSELRSVKYILCSRKFLNFIYMLGN